MIIRRTVLALLVKAHCQSKGVSLKPRQRSAAVSVLDDAAREMDWTTFIQRLFDLLEKLLPLILPLLMDGRKPDSIDGVGMLAKAMGRVQEEPRGMGDFEMSDNRETCICHACIKANDLRGVDGLPLNFSQMIVCPTCGNKRCPKAEDHRYACSGSNEVDQVPVMENRESLGGFLIGVGFVTVLFVCLIAGRCCGAELTAKVNEYDLAVVEADVEGHWLVLRSHKDVIAAVPYFGGGKGIAFTGPAGSYFVQHSNADGITATNVTIGDGTSPNPPPDGDDEIAPVVPAGERLIIVLYETNDSTPELSDLLLKMRHEADEHEWKQHTLALLDDDSPAAESFLKETDARPGIVINSPLGEGKWQTVHAGPLPKTWAEVQALVGRYGG